jgi:DNA-3-methyladenine glycosylase I
MNDALSLHRCAWPGADPLYVAYHDEEWGVPERDSQALFGKLILDGFQAGLSWITILRKREAFRRAFSNFDPKILADLTEEDVERLAADPSIVRSRAKIRAAGANARAYLRMAEAGEDFSAFLWAFVAHEPVQNPWRDPGPAPAQTPVSEAMSKALKARGFSFCGPVIVYAFMQAVGMVNDHAPHCFRYHELGGITPS